MSYHSRTKVWQDIEETGLVCLFYNSSIKTSEEIVSALLNGGARVIEFTNRGAQAHEVFRKLIINTTARKRNLVLGVGSILDPSTASQYINLGANFIVGPTLNPEIAKLCNRRKVAYIPGCATPSEISLAEELGAEICKIFPAKQLGGPGFIRAVRAPCPWAKLMPTGGVNADEEDLRNWFEAGACAVGIGSGLASKDFIKNEQWKKLTELTASCLWWIKKARQEPNT